MNGGLVATPPLPTILLVATLALAGCVAPTDSTNTAKNVHSDGDCINPPGNVDQVCIFTMDVTGYGRCTFAAAYTGTSSGAGAGITFIGCTSPEGA